jgi:hypothetical protein
MQTFPSTPTPEQTAGMLAAQHACQEIATLPFGEVLYLALIEPLHTSADAPRNTNFSRLSLAYRP